MKARRTSRTRYRTIGKLQESTHWDRDGQRLLHQAEQMLGMRGFLVQSHHHGGHLAVLIRESAGIPVARQRHDRAWPYWRALAHLEVHVDGYLRPLHLLNAHLAPASPTIRLAEAETLALVAKDGRDVIAVGDWNAAPATSEDPRPPVPPSPRVRRKQDRGPAQAIEEAGFLDVGAHLGDTTATVGHLDAGFAYRCDRI